MASSVKIWPPGYGTGYGVSTDNVRVWPSGEDWGGGSPGTSGASGYSGVSGTSGVSGYSGASGISGYSGTSGVSGYSGAACAITNIVATADQDVTNSDTLVQSSYLSFTTLPNTNYNVTLKVFFNASSATCGFKYRLNHAGTTTRVIRHRTYAVPNDMSAYYPSAPMSNAFDSVDQSIIGANEGDSFIFENIILQVGASGGVLQFEFAQNTAEALEYVRLYMGSMIQYVIT
jgi:hypothetical protein